MSAKHLGRYLEELEWRFNNRNNPNIFRNTLKRIMNTEKHPAASWLPDLEPLKFKLHLSTLI